MKKTMLFLATIGILSCFQTGCESHSGGHGAYSTGTGSYQTPHRGHAEKKYMRPR